MHWVLVGLMGAGKSTIGRALATRAGRPLVDNDEQLLAMTGRSARELQLERGADGLHELERAALFGALDQHEPSVITAAASVVEDEEARSRLRERALVVWLVAPVDVLAHRAAAQQHRPLGPDAAEVLARQETARRDRFAEVADVVLRTDRAVDAVVDEALQLLSDGGARPGRE